ncbi:hypothetical protein PFHG_05621 [Plasmodium falciparum HB3]|uniref:Duffy-binding-like domain-containing protein n=1 Tax=Plasmodium falciparum (isolate HB3) TaxID=137071 RepID=A0A0L7KN00_PLAFX|nr:hypothetical protein PFHG_05621 [Plasmodium falciparum HB3]
MVVTNHKWRKGGVDSTLNNPKLSDFVLRPTYFRYLEEWGQNFCKERKKRLKQIYKECKVENGGKNIETPKCSCYGEDCETILSKNSYDTVADLECPGCGIECRKYKQWIEKKTNRI